MSTNLTAPAGRTLHTARLERKQCLSEPAQCFHLEFVLDEPENFSFLPGQFISIVALDPNGKQQTRAYSLASAPAGNKIELCVNRADSGFFSNHLADLSPGDTIQMHGPYGYFILKTPITDSLFVTTGTGIAPIRAFTQQLFPANEPDRSEGKQTWLLYGASHQSELFYHEEFQALAARQPNFHYIPMLANDLPSQATQIIEARARNLGISLPLASVDPATPPAELAFDIHAYLCGLNETIAPVRDKLKTYNWHRKQILFERYD